MPSVVVLVLFALLTPSPASAQENVAPPPVPAVATSLPDIQPVQVPLTSDRIERYIASLPDVLSLAATLEQQQGQQSEAVSDDDLAFVLVPYLFDPQTERSVSETIARHGFADYAEWANTAHSIALASEAAAFGGMDDLETQKDGAREEINRDPALNEEQRKAALEELDSQFAALAEFEPLPGNREVVQPFLERLEAAQTR